MRRYKDENGMFYWTKETKVEEKVEEIKVPEIEKKEILEEIKKPKTKKKKRSK